MCEIKTQTLTSHVIARGIFVVVLTNYMIVRIQKRLYLQSSDVNTCKLIHKEVS